MSILYIEKSSQTIPLTSENSHQRELSLPLNGLVNYAPRIPETFDLEDVRYPISNDESAAYYDLTRARMLTPEFQQASNRVALIIGEGALLAALPYIPEETIILLDKSPAMCAFMTKYVDALRNSEDMVEWGRKMNVFSAFPTEAEEALGRRIQWQMSEWQNSGYSHPGTEDEAYPKSRKLAKDKAIIPWNADITDVSAMLRLGGVLRDFNANVTMVNLTNAMGGSSLPESYMYSDILSALPITPNAPILTTGFTIKPTADIFLPARIVEATGPFFGLDNLRKYGGYARSGFDAGAAIDRRYIDFEGYSVSEELTPGSYDELIAEMGRAILALAEQDGLMFGAEELQPELRDFIRFAEGDSR